MLSPTRRRASGFLSLSLPCLLLWLGGPLAAQQGSIAGTVRDSATATPLTAVAVEVVGEEGVPVVSATTDARGGFRFTDLAPGDYTVRFTVPGWRTLEVRGVRVRAGETTTLTARLVEFAYNLNPITVSGQKGTQKLVEAPAAVSVVNRTEVEENAAVSVYDHLESQPGVDLFKTGLQQGYAVARGFNNVFSGSMLSLTDHRIARVPSLRANVLYLNPTTNPDLDRIEVALGPASALYGPNANNGVLHMITKSPIDDPGVTLSVAGGGRSSGAGPETEEVFHAEGRLAAAPSEKFGFKVSAQYFEGTDWFLQWPPELQARQVAGACLGGLAAACTAFPPLVADSAELLARVGERDFDLERWTIDFRADVRPSEEVETIFQGGRTEAVNTIELTGIGAAQAKGWSYTYLQNRTSYKDFFAQVFWNFSDAGNTFLLETGQPIVDESYVIVGQLQNATSIGSRENLIYGFDAIRTVPRSAGTINGVNELDDEITEVGGYLQSETRLSDKFDLILAARLDHHSVIDEVVFSPRAGLLFKPSEGHSVRATFNRAFSTPTTNNLFLDIGVRTIPLGGPFFYGVRAQGTTGTGFTFRRTAGRPEMKSPFAAIIGADASSFLPTLLRLPDGSAGPLWAIAVGLASPNLPAPLVQALLANPPSEEQVPIRVRSLNTTTGRFEDDPRGLEGIEDLPPVDESTTNTFEVGYKGLIGNRLLLSLNGWYESRTNFIGPLRVETPNVFLDGERLAQFLQAFGLSPEQAQAVAIGTEEQPGIARVPLGVLTPEEATGAGANLMLTYQNFGDVDLVGGEIGARVLISDDWYFDANLAAVSDDRFEQDDGPPIALNAPTFKANGTLGYRSEGTGLNGSVQYRFVEGFPVNSGVFVGEVDDYHLVDLTLGYRLPRLRGLRLQVDVSNLFDDAYTPFVGAPEIGRLALVRLVYDLGRF